MGISARRRWHSSETIAQSILSKAGYNILDVHHKIIVNGIEVGEADILAEKDGELYAVEVKAGRADVSSIRQAYVNAKLLNAKPLIIARGFADESSEKLAQELGVNLIPFSEFILVEAEELESILSYSIRKSLEELLDLVLEDIKIPSSYMDLVKAIVSTKNIVEASNKLGISVKELVSRLNEMRGKGIIPRSMKNYKDIRIFFKIYLTKYRIEALLSMLEKYVERLSKEG